MSTLLASVFLFLFFVLIGKIASKVTQNQLSKTHLSHNLVFIVSNVILATFSSIGIMYALADLGMTSIINLTSLIILAASVTLQGIVQSTIEGIIVSFERRFKIGDIITTAGITGTITNIGIRLTTVKTDKERIIIPNTVLYSSPISISEPLIKNSTNKKGLGWIRDIPDFRDKMFKPLGAVDLPQVIDLRPNMPPVYDQLYTSSCTAQAIAGAVEFKIKQQGEQDFIPSRLFIYYNERAMENTVNQDCGASIRDGIKSINTWGVCPETEWSFDPSQLAVKPSTQCYEDALLHTSVKYESVEQDAQSIRECLAANTPVVIGLTLYESFMSSQVGTTGLVPMPTSAEKVVGGHAMLIVGYNDTTRLYLVRNSWGTQWGIGGYCYIPYEYIHNQSLGDDYWAIDLLK